MERHGRHREPGLLAQLAHLYQVNEALHVLFHLVQTAQAVQLLQQLFQRGLRLFLLGGFLLWRLLSSRLRSGRLRFGDKLIGLQGWTVAGQAVLCAQSQQGVGAGVDKTGLRLADHIVHRGKQQQNQGELVHKAAGEGGAFPQVVVPQGLEEGGGLKEVIARHAGGHLPVQGRGGGVGAGVDGVVKLHMPGGDLGGVIRLPNAQGAGAEVVIRLPPKFHAQSGIGDPFSVCTYRLVILLVGLGGGQGASHCLVPPSGFVRWTKGSYLYAKVRRGSDSL